MSEADVSLIHDEDVLRRMWQQTEDFSKKKEIRAHMYRLREERLRNLYSPEPTAEGKGCEFTSSQGHIKSFADQTFQSMKSKEVRDAGSPPKEFTYGGQDLKELSNAGWNVESDTTTADDGRTLVRSVHANIEGNYDVEGGKGQFAAVDQHRRAVTEYKDDNTSLRRNESASSTAAHEQVVQKTDDGSTFSATASSSSTNLKFQEVSTTKRDVVPYSSDNIVDVSRQESKQSNRNVEEASHKQISKTSNFEQSLRSNDSQFKGRSELISRKVEYPDENTKVVVEISALPDGTRVTSTRREIQVPTAQSSRLQEHSQQSINESISSTFKSSHVNESSSNRRDTIDNSARDVKKTYQKDVDNTTYNKGHDIKHNMNIRNDIELKRSNEKHIDTKLEDTQRKTSTLNETDVKSNDTLNIKDNVNQTYKNVSKDTKSEETIEKNKNNDYYQTTYQSDYTQKKISQDPSHQAWASTLRSDNPNSTRSSTRSSSPGSRTYQSSASSLRSSISPEKYSRNPPSRGGSPKKIDRFSPTGTISDRFSSTQSNRSIPETMTSKHTSPERYGSHPNSMSPTRPSLSPDRKFQDSIRQRPSISPETKHFNRYPQETKSNISPEKKSAYIKTASDDRSTPSNDYPGSKSPSKISTAKKPGSNYLDDITTHRPSQSPDRKPGYQQPTFSSNIHSRSSPEKVPTRSNHSPERKAGNKKPETHDITDYCRSSPSRHSPERVFSHRLSSETPPKDYPSEFPDKKNIHESANTTKTHQDEYRYVDEETKVSRRFDKEFEHIKGTSYIRPERNNKAFDESVLPTRKSPTKVGTTYLPQSIRKDFPSRRSPSPPKGPVTFESDVHTVTKKSEKHVTDNVQVNIAINPLKHDIYPDTDSSSEFIRETSPSKYGTYDKKHKYTDNTLQETNLEQTNSPLKEPITHANSLIRNTPRDSSLSPTKTVSKENKFKHSTDFITTEREEYNKKVRNERPRQLVTPSTSPTRKPKTTEKAPSTGQSSPTTSVSEIVYFSSPRQTEQCTIVTDLDDEQFYFDTKNKTEVISTQYYKRPKNLDLQRSPSPSKIPCRSPSPEKPTSYSNDSMTRKSSLKKPSTELTQVSPVEKPPTTFQVSPTRETKGFPEHKVVKKDVPDKGSTSDDILKRKIKPPFERRETYEERCRKILGMTEDKNTEVTKTEKNIKNSSQSNQSSPSISPCNSPARESSPYKEFLIRDKKQQVNDFIYHEKSDISKNITTHREKVSNSDRENSPAKLQDIMSETKVNINDDLLNVCDVNSYKLVSGPKTSTTQPRKANESPRNSPIRSFNQPKHSRSPSPTKLSHNNTQTLNEFIITETEQQVLDKVHNSLRKLSPNRENKPPSRERTPTKTNIILQDLESFTTTDTKSDSSHPNKDTIQKHSKTKEVIDRYTQRSVVTNKPKEQNKPALRNMSPTKKSNAPTDSNTIDKNYTPVYLTKSRSTSPRKPVSQILQHEYSGYRVDSTQIPKSNKVKDSVIYTNNTKNATTKFDKTVVDINKTIGTTSKQNILTKSALNKVAQASITKRAVNKVSAPADIAIKRDSDVKVTRTASDNAMKTKKPSPQRIRSKPEIHVNDISAGKSTNIQNVTTKFTNKEPIKLSTKPKSATALNTTTEVDDVIVDIQQAKSSRENSPDRICPTPVNFLEDVGKPRLPDEVSEPDDDMIKRTHHTIHETESIVDDIVEISEDEELFTKRTNVDRFTESDECLLSVTDKVSKFSNNSDNYGKPYDADSSFNITEKRLHSDFTNENLVNEDSLLTKSEKVSNFTNAKETPKTINRNSVSNEFDIESSFQDGSKHIDDNSNLFIVRNQVPTKINLSQKIESIELSSVDEDLKNDDCLLSVSDKVHKFAKTAEHFLNETQSVEKKRPICEKEAVERNSRDVKEDKVNKCIKKTEKYLSDKYEHDKKIPLDDKDKKIYNHQLGSFTKETVSSHAKVKDYVSPNLKPTESVPIEKITRSSEAVRKAKALFENISSTQKPEERPQPTKLTDIGVIKKSPKTDSTIVLHSSLDDSLNVTNTDHEIDIHSYNRNEKINLSNSYNRPQTVSTSPLPNEYKTRKSPTRLDASSIIKSKSPISDVRNTTVIQRSESPKRVHSEVEKVPNYQRPKATQVKEESTIENTCEVSSRRGSEKFGVELKRTSLERSAISTERRRSSTDHHQPCIEDIFDLDLLEQMLEKVVGYEQRRRIRAQIRVAKKSMESEYVVNTNTSIKSSTNNKQYVTTITPKSKSPDRGHVNDRRDQLRTASNDYVKDSVKTTLSEKRQKAYSPEKPMNKTVTPTTRSPTRHSSPEKKTRTQSPSKTLITPKSKTNRFNEYASAYMKRVGMNEVDNLKTTDVKTKEATTKIENHNTYEMRESKTVLSKNVTERSSSKDTIEFVHINGKRTSSPEIQAKRIQSPERKSQSDRLYQRSPSPDFKRPRANAAKKEPKQETIIKTGFDTENKILCKPQHEEKPSWVMNRNLKKITSETRHFSNKMVENEKKYRAASPSKVISKPIDVITSSYGPGPLDSEGRPLFGIKALRNGATNYQVKGTVIRQEFHSHNGSEPEGTISVTAYSNNSEDLEKLLKVQDEKPSRIHGLAAITTTKKFGGKTGTSLKESHSKEEQSLLDHFTSNNRRTEHKYNSGIDSITENKNKLKIGDKSDSHKRSNTKTEDRRVREVSEDDKRSKLRHETKRVEEKRTESKKMEEKKTVRQSSVKSLTEKYIKNATDTPKGDRNTYPKAGLILRTTTLKDGVFGNSSTHGQGLMRTDSDRSINSTELETFTETETTSSHENMDHGSRHTTTTTTKCRRSSKQSDVSNERSSDVSRVTSQNYNWGNSNQSQNTATKTEKSFLDSSSKVTGVQDIISRMKNADIVIAEGDSNEDAEARALLNKFLGATVLMAGMQGYVQERPGGRLNVTQETATGSGQKARSEVRDVDIDNCWDERILRKLLEKCSDYEQRRDIRARIRVLMAEQEACASAVAEALGAAGEAAETDETREEEVTTVTSSVRKDSSEKTVSSSTTTKTTKVIDNMTRPAPKPASPFAKFRQLEKQNPSTIPSSPKTPQSPGSASQPYFKFTDPALQSSAATIKERLLLWCRDKTRDYENVKLENFSTSWSDGLAFCALMHHFLPDAFDYSVLTPDKRRHNFTLAFKVADEKAGIYPLLDVDDMVAMRKPDWKCVFTYVQAIYRRFKDES